MSIHHSLLLVEGQQDVLFLSRLFQELGYRYVNNIEEVPERWSIFINERRKSEHHAKIIAGKSGLMLHELFEGACLLNKDQSIVIQAVGGKREKFQTKLNAIDGQLDGTLRSLNAIGLFPDADDNLRGALESSQNYLSACGVAPPQFNGICGEELRVGIFVFPNGHDDGGLEEILLECAEIVYPKLLKGAQRFVEEVVKQKASYSEEDMKELNTPQGPAKAIVGCISSVLTPGSTIQVSLRNNRWVSAESVNSAEAPRVAALKTFLQQLCGLS